LSTGCVAILKPKQCGDNELSLLTDRESHAFVRLAFAPADDVATAAKVSFGGRFFFRSVQFTIQKLLEECIYFFYLFLFHRIYRVPACWAGVNPIAW
jgi:hypothetical protein